MDHTSGATDENLPIQDGRWREGGDVALESERPFQIEAPHLING